MVVPSNNMRAMGAYICTQALHACTVKRPVEGPVEIPARFRRAREQVLVRLPRYYPAETPAQHAPQPCHVSRRGTPEPPPRPTALKQRGPRPTDLCAIPSAQSPQGHTHARSRHPCTRSTRTAPSEAGTHARVPPGISPRQLCSQKKEAVAHCGPPFAPHCSRDGQQREMQTRTRLD